MVLGAAVCSRFSVSCCEVADLDEVVGEDASSATGSGAVDAGLFGAVPAVASFEVVDPSFGSGAPFDLVAEGAAVFDLAARGSWFARTGDRHTAHAEVMEVAFHRCLAIPTVGSDRAWRAPGATGDPFDRGRQLRCVSGVSDLDGLVDDDPVVVVDDLSPFAELNPLSPSAPLELASTDTM